MLAWERATKRGRPGISSLPRVAPCLPISRVPLSLLRTAPLFFPFTESLQVLRRAGVPSYSVYQMHFKCKHGTLVPQRDSVLCSRWGVAVATRAQSTSTSKCPRLSFFSSLSDHRLESIQRFCVFLIFTAYGNWKGPFGNRLYLRHRQSQRAHHLFLEDLGSLVRLYRAGDRTLQLLLFNKEFIVSAIHRLTLRSALPKTARC